MTDLAPGLSAHSARPQPVPDPDATAAALLRRPTTGWVADQSRYGKATDDPLGRTVAGTARTGMIPKRAEESAE